MAVIPGGNRDAVDFCVARIHAANSCGNFVRINRILEIDSEVTENEALVTAELVVLSSFTACSPIASTCTGSCWDPKSGKAQLTSSAKESFNVTSRLRIERAFAFQKADDGWRCKEDELAPVDSGVASGP